MEVILFHVKCVTNGNSYDVGSTEIVDTGHGLNLDDLERLKG